MRPTVAIKERSYRSRGCSCWSLAMEANQNRTCQPSAERAIESPRQLVIGGHASTGSANGHWSLTDPTENAIRQVSEVDATAANDTGEPVRSLSRLPTYCDGYQETRGPHALRNLTRYPARSARPTLVNSSDATRNCPGLDAASAATSYCARVRA